MARYRIMTFDGGGVRGSLMATLVKRLVEQVPDLLNQVDLFAVTSTGSVVALSLAYGFSADTLVSFYSQQNLRAAFSPAHLNWFRPKYDNSNFMSLLKQHFPGDPRLSDITAHRVTVTSFQLDDKHISDWCPHFFHNYPKSPYLHLPIVDCALRSAAAPTIFPSHQGYIDGGMMANNPSTSAIVVALGHHDSPLELSEVSLLSIGTGLSPTIVKTDTSRWGVVQWLLNPFRSPSEPLLNILFDGVVEADHIMSGHLLGSRYWRLNPQLTAATALDDWKAIPELIQIANDFDLAPTLAWIKANWS